MHDLQRYGARWAFQAHFHDLSPLCYPLAATSLRLERRPVMRSIRIRMTTALRGTFGECFAIAGSHHSLRCWNNWSDRFCASPESSRSPTSSYDPLRTTVVQWFLSEISSTVRHTRGLARIHPTFCPTVDTT